MKSSLDLTQQIIIVKKCNRNRQKFDKDDVAALSQARSKICDAACKCLPSRMHMKTTLAASFTGQDKSCVQKDTHVQTDGQARRMTPQKQ